MLTDVQWMLLEPLVETCRPRQGGAAASAAHDQRDPMATHQWRQTAHRAGRTWATVEGGAGFHPPVAPWRLGAPADAGPEEGHATRDNLPRRHRNPRSSQSGRHVKKRTLQHNATCVKRLAALVAALIPTPACSRTVLAARLPSFWHRAKHMNCRMLWRFSTKCRGGRKWVVADQGYSSHAFRRCIWVLGT